MNKNNKGFTLIELLAVIIVLALLMMFAVPKILDILNKSRVNAFRSQAESIYKAAQNQAVSEKASGKHVKCYRRVNGVVEADNADNSPSVAILDLNGNKEVDYYVSFNNDEINLIKIYDRNSKYSLSGSNLTDLNINSIESQKITDVCKK